MLPASGTPKHLGKPLRRGNDFVDGVRIGGVGRNAEIGESANGVEAVQTFGDEHEIGMQGGDGFEARIDGAADFGFLLGVGREIAVVGVADEAILQAKRVDGFCEAGGERDDALHGLRDADGAAGFVGDFAVGRRGWRRSQAAEAGE